MSKGIAALAYLPQIDLVLPTGNAVASLEAFKGLANEVAKMQSQSIADGTYGGTVARGNNPYDSSIWSIVVSVSGTVYTCTFTSEVVNQNTGAVGRAALSTRRKVDLLKATGAVVSMRSFLALLNFVEGLEDKVAETGAGATGDATYTAIALRGNTPFKTYEWTVTKLADLYTCASTANSN
tara:strand:- start:408 stop:950 length:543 start_codon:yes stop_codon:yes gene_type:complete